MSERCSVQALVRFADDFLIGFELEDDAQRVMAVLGKRLAKYGLELHPDKTRLVEFRHPSEDPPSGQKPGTIDFLGFTHYWRKSRRGDGTWHARLDVRG